MKTTTLHCFLIGGCCLQLAMASVVNAQDGTETRPVQNPQQILETPDYRGPLDSRRTLFGDFAGARQDLANDGITLDGILTQVAQGVVSGGIDRGWEYGGRGEVTFNADTAKMGWWPGGLLTVMGEGNYGEPLTARTGSLLGANMNELLPETDDTFDLPQVSFTQFLSPSFGISLGKFATINDKGGDMNEFAHGKGSTQFLNLSFNVNPVTALVVPYSTLGISAIALPTDDLTVVASVLDPHGKPGKAGLDELFENGATFSLEGRHATKFFGNTGHQLLGAAYSSSDYADLDEGVATLIIPGLPTKQADGSWAVYWNADQYLYQPDSNVDAGIGTFARFGFSDGEANPIRSFASAGVGGKGMIPGRENDSFGVGYFYTWIADNRITSQLGFGDAQGVEGYYQVALTPALFLAPDIQWIAPSQQRVDSSWILGVRVTTAL